MLEMEEEKSVKEAADVVGGTVGGQRGATTMIAVYRGVEGLYRRRGDGVEDESMGELMVKRRLGA
jgi:hypothetical protein